MTNTSGKVVLAQPAAALLPPRPAGPVRGGGDARTARLRYQSLLRDFQELAKETEAKKNRLHAEKLKKQRLLAEVKFLRTRYKSMSENPSQAVVYRVKNTAMTPALQSAMLDHDNRCRSVQVVGSSSKDPSSQRRRPNFTPRVPPVIDLNEACEQSSEETEEFHGYQGPGRVDKVNNYPLSGEDVAAADGPSEMKMPGFWDIRSPAVRAGKRKISWQDQLALRV